MAKYKKPLHPDAPLYHQDHSRPVTRRDFLRQGFISGTGMVLGGSLISLFANPRAAEAALSSDLQTLAASINCSLGGLSGAQKIPYICFDLAGGVNISGSNVLVGGQGGQMDFLSTAGYSKLGLPGDMIPGVAEPVPTGTSNGDHTDTTYGLAFHSDSAFLRGILEKAPTRGPNTNGAVIAARSDNDTGDNPLNPMYGIATAGAAGSVVTLIGSRNSDSGGNSMAPEMMINPEIRPTKVDRPSDVTGMVDTGNLTGILSDPADVLAVMESIARISEKKLALVNPKLPIGPPDANQVVKDLMECGYLKAADLADRFAGVNIDPAQDTQIVGAAGVFTQAEFDGEREFRKTASVMKMVIDGYAGAGTITMGGYDYHTGDRSTGEVRDLRAGRCMGACLEYAARRGVPLMMQVISDGSVASNGNVDNSADGRGKGEWTGDNSSTAGSFFLVYNPTARPVLLGGTPEEQAVHQQIGYMRADASVETASSPAANNPNLQAQVAVLNYMALNGDQANFPTLFPGHGLGDSTLMDSLTGFAPLA
ncbi:MAG TPA: general secretion pathway protein GspF [Chromatiales bacterium]|nr:general secretion pathway protein GspF [Thiotrichales bacterium]HIP68292.1 general secretion pathway protein GspF [Chromatiales bacterium]